MKLQPPFQFEKDHEVMLQKWADFLREFSYKPNWQFQLDGDRLTMIMHVPDSRVPVPDPQAIRWGQQRKIPLVAISKTITVYEFYGEKYAMDFLRFHIRDAEGHEIDEWFRYKGELPFDPHKEV